MPSPNPGFISLQDYLTANQGALGNTAQTLADAGAQQAQHAQGEADQVANSVRNASQAAGQPLDPSMQPGYDQAAQDAIAAQGYLNNLGSFGGLAADTQQQFGKSGNYTTGDNRFDATLLSSSPQAQKTFADTQGKYGDLLGYLQNAANTGAQVGGTPVSPTNNLPGRNPFPSSGTPSTIDFKPPKDDADSILNRRKGSGGSPYGTPKGGF